MDLCFFLVGWFGVGVDVGLFLCFFLSFVCLIVGICGMQILVDEKTEENSFVNLSKGLESRWFWGGSTVLIVFVLGGFCQILSKFH